MAKPGQTKPRAFRKPDYWSDAPAPQPGPPRQEVSDPDGLSPTRFGDWVKNGIAVDF